MAKVNTVGLMTDKEIAKMIANRIIKERKVKGMDQETLAKKAGVTLSAIRSLEQAGHIPLEKLIAVLRALGRVNVFEELFDFDKEYLFLSHDEYQEIQSKQNIGYVRKKAKKDLW